jgi:hypothetical protein
MDLVPDAWLANPREGYVDYFVERLSAAAFVEEALRARHQRV